MAILLTGGNGYIGSHICTILLDKKVQVIIVDDFSNSKKENLDTIQEISKDKPKLYCIDVCNKEKMRVVFQDNKIDAVIHLAASKYISESLSNPLKYYRNNLDSLITMLELCKEFSCKSFVFSSSASLYPPSYERPCSEDLVEQNIINPYAATKAMGEQIIKDYCESVPEASACILRYFNPVGSHPSHRIGDSYSDTAGNLIPIINQVALGEREHLEIFGDDYPTPDGTCIRDYIHIMDLAEGHIIALDYLKDKKGCEIINLGTGTGYSVKEVLETYKKVNSVKIPAKIAPRRPGDGAAYFASCEKAEKQLGFKANRDLNQMLKDAYEFAKVEHGERS